MSAHTNGSHELISASYSSRKDRESGTYTSLLKSNGSFGSTFWRNDKTNRAGSGSNEETWSTAANPSTVEESVISQDDKWSLGENITTAKAKRNA